MQAHACISIGNKPLLLMLLYKELHPEDAGEQAAGKQKSRRAEARSGDRTWSGVGAESEAELEAETCSLQTAGCRCNSNT